MLAQEIIKELKDKGNPEKSKILSRFFKTGEGQYGEGDLFLGVTVPEQREIAKKFHNTSFHILEELLYNPYHEVRLTGLLILLEQFSQSKELHFRENCINFYLSHTSCINNWDLVDLTCYKLLGRWLIDKKRTPLYQLAKSKNIWEQRIAIVSCMYFVKRGDFEDCLSIAEQLLFHPHDLIQKAVGWLLREVGKKDQECLILFLSKHHQKMPRTMLRYAIERLPEKIRQTYYCKSSHA